MMWLLVMSLFVFSNANSDDQCIDPKNPPSKSNKVPLIYHSGWT